jgi:four helix bundle protein
VAKLVRFNFKRLDVYQAAVEHLAWTLEVLGQLPTVAPFVVRNQLLGAALSIPANVAEANGRDRRAGEAEQHYRFAQGSAYECAAYLDAVHAMGLIDDDQYNQREEHLARIASMLDRLARRHANRRPAMAEPLPAAPASRRTPALKASRTLTPCS